MDILKKFSYKSIKLNKKRTISTIIGIILSSALICGVATLVTSGRQTLIESAIQNVGYYHLKINNLTNKDVEQIKNNRDVKKVILLYENGFASFKESKNEYKPYLRMCSMDKESFEHLDFELIDGNFPINNNEIIISEHTLSNGKVPIKIGDEILLDIGKRMTQDGYELGTSNPYYTYQDLHNEDGTLKAGINEADIENLEIYANKTYKVVGIMKRPSSQIEPYYCPGYTAITSAQDIGKISAYIILENPFKYKDSFVSILGANNYSQVEDRDTDLKYLNYSINNELLKWEVFAFSDKHVAIIYYSALLIIIIIMITSIFCIRNSFAIATTEKMKIYGMLSSIGATEKQIKRSVLFEAMVLALIGIPIGIVSGVGAIWVLLRVVNVILKGNMQIHIIYNISILSIIISIILGFITIYLSALSSAKKATKASPIENLRNFSDVKIKSKKLKSPKIIEKLFKIGGVLAYKNLKRSKRKYRTTVVSLAVSICIFIGMNSFVKNILSTTNMYYTDYDYNYVVTFDTDTPKSTIKQVENIEEIKNKYLVYNTKFHDSLHIKELDKVDLSDGINLLNEPIIDEETGMVVGKGDKYFSLDLIILDDNTFRSYVEKIGQKYDDIKEKGILCDEYDYYEQETEKKYTRRRYTYKKGDVINGNLNGHELSLSVGAISQVKPYRYENTFFDGGFLVLNQKYYENIDVFLKYCCIYSEDPEAIDEKIDKIDSTIKTYNFKEQAQREKNILLVVNIFLYGFIFVIISIGITNIFNTITSNMELRQKEFAMLKSIGMTKSEFNKMINLETIFYSTKALLFGVISGLAVSLIIYKTFQVNMGSNMYIPFIPIIISIIFVFILVHIIMKYSINKINNQNTIETIRKDNI